MFRRPVKSALYIDFNNIAAQFVGGGFGDAFDKADKEHRGRLTREEFNSAWTEYKSTN